MDQKVEKGGRRVRSDLKTLPLICIHFGTFRIVAPNTICQGYVPLTLDVMRVAFKVPLAFHTPL